VLLDSVANFFSGVKEQKEKRRGRKGKERERGLK